MGENNSLENKLEGICYFYTETGTEGGFWAFQDSQYIISPSQWSYEGLSLLEDGDQLIVYNPDNPREIVWSGIIDLEQLPLFKEQAYGFWIHADQKGIDRQVWAKFFLKEYPAQLIKKKD